MTFFRRFSFKAALPLAAVLFLPALISCGYLPVGSVSLTDIQENPSRYEGKDVKVRGKVTDITRIPFVEVKMYTLEDDGVRIMVTASKDLPAVNDQVFVEGRLESVAVVKNINLGLHLTEKGRYPDHFK
jgi:hypothetical protein